MYDHYIGLDWAQSVMAIARLTKGSDKAKVIEVVANVSEFKIYLKSLKGSKILTFEETTTAQWLYTELVDHVDEIVVCDAYRNKLLSEGPKTDKIDAQKLAILLKGGFLKPVFHSGDDFVNIRKLVSGYEDCVKAGVRLKNQRSALLRAHGKDIRTEKTNDKSTDFVLGIVDQGIKQYGITKRQFEDEFKALKKQHKLIRNLYTIPGIGIIGAVQLVARVVDMNRFPNKNHFYSYCGLVKHDRVSGGRSYGHKEPRYCRMLKKVFKTAAMSVINQCQPGPLRDYYCSLITEKRYADHDARHAVARRIATVTFGVWRSGKKFDAQRIQKTPVSST
jgi:transposase